MTGLQAVDGAVEGLAHAVEQFFLGHQHLQGVELGSLLLLAQRGDVVDREQQVVFLARVEEVVGVLAFDAMARPWQENQRGVRPPRSKVTSLPVKAWPCSFSA